MKRGIILILSVIALIFMGTIVVKRIHFKQDCAGYLKQVADASTPELALERLNKALDYVEAHNLTSGYTSVFWRTEDQNVEFWYKNLKACQAELEGCLEGTQLEKSNVLMRVRETLTDDGGEDGTKLTIPSNLAFYPDNAFYLIARCICYIILLAGAIVVCSYID